METFCRKLVDNIYTKHQRDKENTIERKDLLNWLSDELKDIKEFKDQPIQKSFEEFFKKPMKKEVIDKVTDKIEKSQVYDYCLKNLAQNKLNWWLSNSVLRYWL